MKTITVSDDQFELLREIIAKLAEIEQEKRGTHALGPLIEAIESAAQTNLEVVSSLAFFYFNLLRTMVGTDYLSLRGIEGNEIDIVYDFVDGIQNSDGEEVETEFDTILRLEQRVGDVESFAMAIQKIKNTVSNLRSPVLLLEESHAKA